MKVLERTYDARHGSNRRPAADRLRHRGQAGLHGGGRHRRRARAARGVSVHARAVRDDVSRTAVDDSSIRGLRLRRGDEREVSLPARARPDRPVGRLRSADPARLRLGRSARRGRGRENRRRDRLARRHGDPPRGDPARSRLDVDDDQRSRGSSPPSLRAGCRGAGRVGREAARDGAERRSEGVRRAGQLHLSAAAVHAARNRPLRLLRGAAAGVQHHLDLRVPHPRGGSERCAGARVHARQRDRVLRSRGRCRPLARRLRGAAVLLLQRAQPLLPGGREVPRCPPSVGRDHARPLRRHEPARAGAALPRADGRLDAHGAAAGEQHRARRHPGAVRASAAARSRSTPTRSTRRSRCRPSTPPRSRCARSRSSRPRPAPPTPPTLSAARTSSRRSPTSSPSGRQSSSRASTSSGAQSQRSSRASSRPRSKRRRSAFRPTWSRASESSSA